MPAEDEDRYVFPMWQNRDLAPIPVETSSLTSDSSSSDESSKKRRKWRLKCSVPAKLAEAPSQPPCYTLYPGKRRHRTFVHVKGLLDARDIQRVHAIWRHPSVQEIRDRKSSLLYRHVAYRIELPLRAHGERIYHRMMSAMFWTDTANFGGRLSRSKVVFPEAEYIVYDARGSREPGEIEPHVDNHSAVTIVVLLAHPSEFRGGASCFEAAEKGSPDRQVSLQRGDAVIFRGEKLTHWITPVTDGVRCILQIELSRV
uniref:Fe2OG dioxygenase domain-containing protein n=1 Tax=Noctiluca scintillans TaxID=2966 RepID=A0A7S1AJT7_NOCSC